MLEYCLNVEQTPQPSPRMNQYGDCFACALTSTLSHLFPERSVSLPKVFDFFKTQNSSGNEVVDCTFSGMENALKNVKYNDDNSYDIEYRYDLVLPNFTHAYDRIKWNHEWWWFEPTQDWIYRLEGWLRMGFVGMIDILFSGEGPLNNDIKLRMVDHFVVVDGVKYGREATGEETSSINYYAHIVCSVKGKYWIDIRDLLRKHGAAAFWLVRRDPLST